MLKATQRICAAGPASRRANTEDGSDMEKLRVVDGAVVVDHVGGAPVFAGHKIAWIAQRPAVQAIKDDL